MIRIWKGWGDDWVYRGSMTYMQNRKYKALRKDGLSPILAREFIWYDFYQAYMRRFRAGIRRGVAGNTKESVWKWWRFCYESAIEKGRRGMRGGYRPPTKPYDPNQPHKKLSADGSINYTHSREYERERRSKQKRDKTEVPKDVISVMRDWEGNIIGGVRQDEKTGRFEVWEP